MRVEDTDWSDRFVRASRREYEEMHKPPQPGEDQAGGHLMASPWLFLSGEPINVSGPSSRFGTDQRKFSVISFTGPGKIKYFVKVIYWIDSIKKEQSDHISLILFEH